MNKCAGVWNLTTAKGWLIQQMMEQLGGADAAFDHMEELGADFLNGDIRLMVKRELRNIELTDYSRVDFRMLAPRKKYTYIRKREANERHQTND